MLQEKIVTLFPHLNQYLLHTIDKLDFQELKSRLVLPIQRSPYIRVHIRKTGLRSVECLIFDLSLVFASE